MNKLYGQIRHENHLNHLVRMLPFITIMYLGQCYFVYHFIPHVPVGDYAMYLGFTIISFVAALMYYDTHYEVKFFENHLHVSFNLTGAKYEIKYDHIKSITAPTDDHAFGTIAIELNDGAILSFYFVDNAWTISRLILELKNKKTHGTKLDQVA